MFNIFQIQLAAYDMAGRRGPAQCCRIETAKWRIYGDGPMEIVRLIRFCGDSPLETTDCSRPDRDGRIEMTRKRRLDGDGL